MEDCIDHGWVVDTHILWITNTVPAEFTDIVFSINENEDDYQDEIELDNDGHDDYDINLDD